MGGKSNKGKNKWRALNSTPVTSSESQSKPLDPLTSPNDGSEAAKVSNGNANGVEEARNKSPAADGSAGDKAQNSDAPATTTDQAEGALHILHLMLYFPSCFVCLFWNQMSFFPKITIYACSFFSSSMLDIL